MAKKQRKKVKKRQHWAWKVCLALVCLLALFFVYMYGNARLVHVRYTTVYLRDLPTAFEGTTVLFAADIDAKSTADARAAARLFRRLEALQPDILLLGGDYAGLNFMDQINGIKAEDSNAAAEMTASRNIFFSALQDFSTPLGKFAVASSEDIQIDQLRESMQTGGVQLISGSNVQIQRDGASIRLAGVPSDGSGISQLGDAAQSRECVIAMAHNPKDFVGILTSEASDGGAWADLMLAGKTHGGQMRIGDRTLFTLSEHEQRYLAGWRKEGKAFLLTTQGVGCEYIDLRLNTSPEVHLITLRRAEISPEEDYGISMQ